ncbi:MAG: alpha/beta fold hydrolase [Pseudomonadota bacterium]
MSLTRRAVIAASLAGLAASKAARGDSQPRESLTFVCVPGTWHGGWVWTPLAEALRRRGHRCFRVTCTGVGERAHLLRPDVGLDTHARDVTQVIRYEALERVVLVGHSVAGVTITEVADRLAGSGRVAALLYYDAFVPTPERPAWVMRDDAGQWTEPASFANGGWRDYPRAYVHCTGQTYRQSSSAMYGPAKAPGWQFEASDTVRLGMLTAPEYTAALFERIGNNLLTATA